MTIEERSDAQIVDELVDRFPSASPADGPGGGGEDDPSPGRLEGRVPARLRDRLVASAERDGLLDLSYRSLDSPLGPLLLVATPAGLVRVAFHCEGHDAVLARLAERISPRILRAPRRLDVAARQLDEYFDRRRRQFEVPIDLRLVHGFRRTVLECLQSVAYGTTESYTTLARAAGSPAAVRAVGSACANNPLPVVVPCHRVVRRDGVIGQYLGGTEAKRVLLALEAA